MLDEAGLLTARYQDLVKQGTLKPDPLQAATVARLQMLSDELRTFSRRVEEHNREVEAYQV